MIAKWKAFLGAFDIQYRPRTSIKGQVLVDFVAEFTPEQAKVLQIEGSRTMEPREQIRQVYMDGASNCQGQGLELYSSLQKELEWKNHSDWVFLHQIMKQSMKLSSWGLECQDK